MASIAPFRAIANEQPRQPCVLAGSANPTDNGSAMSMTLVELLLRERDAAAIPRAGPLAIRPVVVDANVLAEDVYHTLFRGQSALLDSAELGVVRLFTPAHIYGKVYRVLADMAYGPRAGMAVKAISVWETKYLPVLRFVDMDSCHVDDDRIVA